VPTVQQTWLACERFVMLGCVALGLLQLVALRFPGWVWVSFTCYLIRRLALQSLHLRGLPHSRGNHTLTSTASSTKHRKLRTPSAQTRHE
jgi:hypothetical protein